MKIPGALKRLLLSIIIGLACLELFIRLGFALLPRFMPLIYVGGAHPRNLVIADGQTGYALNPGFACKETNDYEEYHVNVKINSLGMRDYENNAASLGHKGGYKIMGIGDSYTFGEGVELDQSYLALLENMLRQEYAPREITVFKAGVPGYGTKQEVELLKKRISLLKPDLVIMALLADEYQRSNDPYAYLEGYIVDRSKVDKLYLVGGRLYSSRAKNKKLGLIDAAIKHYYLTPQFMQHTFKTIRKRNKPKSPRQNLPLNKEQLRQKFSYTLLLLKEFKGLCEANGAKPMLILIEGDERQNEYLYQQASALGIPTLDLLPYFKKAAEDNIPYHFQRDKHWNPQGHKICAWALYDFILEEGPPGLRR